MEEKGSKKRMPTLVERFEAVVRENEQLKQKIKELEKSLARTKSRHKKISRLNL